MEPSNNIIKNSLFAILFLVLFLPLIQNSFTLRKLHPLNGTVAYPNDVEFSKDKWISAEYQEKKETYLNTMFGFRSLFVKLNNQIAYSFFGKAKANGVIIGKDNYLYEESYLNAYTGRDFLGEDSINHTLNRLKFISDTLNKLNKQLIVVFAAGKASFYPEFIPDKYLPVSDKTNYKYLSDGAKKLGLNVIDFNKWFMDNKHKSEYPLYPQQGVHWSTYGTALAADSLIKKIEALRNIDAPNLLFDGVDMQQAHDVDYDIADGMNLLFKIKGFDVAYPRMKLVIDSGKIKPKVLVISDSFYWGMYNLGIANCFKNDHFWYYNKQVYPESNTKETLADQQDFRTVIDSHEVFVIMATEATLRKISWGFIERAEQFFKGIDITKVETKSPEYIKKLQGFVSYIKTQPNWLKDAESRAKDKNISLDSMLVIEAMWQLDHPTN
jgi:hypothetical protein